MPQPRGVVVHLDEADPDKHVQVLRNVANLRAELGRQVPVELVVHGPGLDAVLAGGPHRDAVDALISDGVQVSACENTMHIRQVTHSDLAAGVGTVPAGVAQLARRQLDGWAYLRP